MQAEEQALRQALAEVGVQRVTVEAAGSPGRLAVTLESAPGQDVRSQIAAKVVGKGWPLFELRGINLSLEDVFLELTTDDSSHAQQNKTEESHQS